MRDRCQLGIPGGERLRPERRLLAGHHRIGGGAGDEVVVIGAGEELQGRRGGEDHSRPSAPSAAAKVSAVKKGAAASRAPRLISARLP